MISQKYPIGVCWSIGNLTKQANNLKWWKYMTFFLLTNEWMDDTLRSHRNFRLLINTPLVIVPASRHYTLGTHKIQTLHTCVTESLHDHLPVLNVQTNLWLQLEREMNTKQVRIISIYVLRIKSSSLKIGDELNIILGDYSI